MTIIEQNTYYFLHVAIVHFYLSKINIGTYSDEKRKGIL